MRILLVIDSLETGGAQTLVCAAASTLASRGDTVVGLVVLYPILSEAWRLQGTLVTIISLEMRDKRDLRRGARLLCEEIARFRPDVVHAHLFPADLVTVLAMRNGHGPARRVLSEHAEWNRRRNWPFSRQLDRWVYGHYDPIVCVSNLVETSLAAWIPSVRGHTVVIRNAVDVPVSPWNAGGPFATDLVFVGRLVKQKGLDILIDALAVLRARSIHPSLEVVGDGPNRPDYEDAVHRRKLTGQVRFVGERRNAEAHMRGARVLVMPSRFEGLSMVLLEAMALGMPIVATAVSGASEVIRDGCNGFLVPPRDVVALANGIDRVLRNDVTSGSMGGKARASIGREFSMTAYASRLSHVYNGTIDLVSSPDRA